MIVTQYALESDVTVTEFHDNGIDGVTVKANRSGVSMTFDLVEAEQLIAELTTIIRKRRTGVSAFPGRPA